MAPSKKKQNPGLEGVYFHCHYRRQQSFRRRLLHRSAAASGCLLLVLAAVSFFSQPVTNHLKTSIIDAVVVAYILNATLIVPKLDQESFWNDSSKFSDIYDADWFMKYLSKEVKIIKELPDEKSWKVVTTRVPRKCNPKCYLSRVLPMFQKKKAVELTKFDYRLSNWLDEDLQKLRCRVNYHALRFNNPIFEMGKKLVERVRMKSKRFVALHLRYEPDMLAFSGCYYGGGEKEINELAALRTRWKTLRSMDPERERRNGKCLLSPEEVALLLRALGFGHEAHIYVASGQIYGGKKALAPLKALFPNIHTKETLASNQELSRFSSHSSRMAALDFIVSDESDVLVTNNNGNMAKILAGRRRYFGHKPTIRPNTRKLNELFVNRKNMTWDEFSSRVRTNQIGFMGDPSEVNRATDSFHENPFSCICQNFEPFSANQIRSTSLRSQVIPPEYNQDSSEMEYFDDD
ncbi:O-fucosyltransferase family protein [Striga hermonthica]|uniref:O-fucosyltransferase family protein n=1 Tax=Striga hermonthica TaxID=68872 RepID=A0A9N7RDJ5_STRHE|nr:O-fucosyltransferase family protein [Striga hermonthica]